MATIRKHKAKSGKLTYTVSIRLRGHKPTHKTFDRKTDAKDWARSTEASIKEGRYGATAESQRHTFGEMIDRYLSLTDHPNDRINYLIWWKDKLGERSLANVTPADISELRDDLRSGKTHKGTPRSNAAVNRRLAYLSKVYSIAMKEWGWVEKNPCFLVSKLKEPRGRVRFLSYDERDRLLESCARSYEPHLYSFTVLALSTGARAGELQALRWCDLDLDKGIGILHHTKNGERRRIPITGPAKDLLIDMSKVRHIQHDQIFCHQDGRVPFNYYKSWQKAVNEAEVEDFRFHDCRHTAASYAAMNGASLIEIADLLGHKTLQMVKRYAHLSDQHVADVGEKLTQSLFAS